MKPYFVYDGTDGVYRRYQFDGEHTDYNTLILPWIAQPLLLYCNVLFPVCRKYRDIGFSGIYHKQFAFRIIIAHKASALVLFPGDGLHRTVCVIPAGSLRERLCDPWQNQRTKITILCRERFWPFLP